MFYQIILLFALYSFLGWACETVYCSIPAKKFVNRGFLNGPFCPVYGFGALLVIFFLTPFQNNIALLFVSGVVVTSVLEYFTAFLLEKLFHTKWWDYSHRKGNIHGRVCPLNSIIFGLLSVFVMWFIHPFFQSLLGRLPSWLFPVLAFGFIAYFLTDMVITVHTILQLNHKLENLHEKVEELERRKEEYKAKLHDKLTVLDADTKNALQQRINKLAAGLEEMLQNNPFSQKRLLRAFPNMQSLRHKELLNKMKNAVKNRNHKQR